MCIILKCVFKCIVFFCCMFSMNLLFPMEALPEKYDATSIIDFREEKHCDTTNHIHYGFVHGFLSTVVHTGFAVCSVQDGLKKAQNVYIEKNKLIITKECDRWIDVLPSNDKQNESNLNCLIKAINFLIEKQLFNNDNVIDTIEIQIPSIKDNRLNRFSTALFSNFLNEHFFHKLEKIKNVYYIPAHKTKSKDDCRLFVYQDIIDFVSYVPLILTGTKGDKSIIEYGVIGKRFYEDNGFDMLSFNSEKEAFSELKHVVNVHPTIIIQEIIQDILYKEHTYVWINEPPLHNRMLEYPFDLLYHIARKYKIKCSLLVAEDQWKKLPFCQRTTPSVFYGYTPVEQCLQRGYQVGIDLTKKLLIINNSEIYGNLWIKPLENNKEAIEEAYANVCTQVRFLCWFNNIDTIEIRVPKSSECNEIPAHSLAVLSQDSLNFFKKLSPIVKEIRYAPYNFHHSPEVYDRVIYIHPDIFSFIFFKGDREEKYYKIDNITLVVKSQVDIKVLPEKRKMPDEKSNALSYISTITHKIFCSLSYAAWHFPCLIQQAEQSVFDVFVTRALFHMLFLSFIMYLSFPKSFISFFENIHLDLKMAYFDIFQREVFKGIYFR